MSAHLEDAKPPNDISKDRDPGNKPAVGEHHPFFVLSFSTMIYALVGTAGVLVAFFANFWLGMAIIVLAAAGIAVYVGLWVRKQTKQLTEAAEQANMPPQDHPGYKARKRPSGCARRTRFHKPQRRS